MDPAVATSPARGDETGGGNGFDDVELAEADQVQSEILEPVDQAVELGVILDTSSDAGAPAGRFDRDVGEQGCHQGSALAAQDDPVPVAGAAESGHSKASLSPDDGRLSCVRARRGGAYGQGCTLLTFSPVKGLPVITLVHFSPW